MLLEMAKVEFVGPKRIFCEAVSYLHRIGTVDIDDMSQHQSVNTDLFDEMKIDDDTRRKMDGLEDLQKRIDKIFEIIRRVHKQKDLAAKKKIYSRIWAGGCDEFTAETHNILNRVENKVKRPGAKKEQLVKELSQLKKYSMVMEKVQPMIADMVSLEGFDTIVFIMEEGYEAVIEAIDERLQEMTQGQYDMIRSTLSDGSLSAIVIFSTRFAKEVRDYLYSEKVDEIHLPEAFADMPIDEALDNLKKREEVINLELDAVNKELDDISKDWYTRLAVMNDVIGDRIEEFIRMSNFAATEYTFLITGWMPGRDFKKNKKALQKEFGGQVLLNKIEVTEIETRKAPVAYYNSKITKPYEVIMKAFQTPKYGTVDPTPFLAITFPIFFGMMVGDAAYGLLFLILAQWARRKWGNMLVVRDVTFIATIASISTIFFGLVFGEFFGDLPHRFHWVREFHIAGIKFPVDRLEMLKPILFLSIAIGVTHLTFGLILGVINAFREKSRGHVYERSGFLVLIVGMILLILTSAGLVASNMMVLSVWLLVSAIALIIIGGGAFAVIEVLSFFGNILSYARLSALGIASVVLALIANQLGGSIGVVWVGVFVAALLHTLNIVLGAFSPTIHALRLNFVEFFGKFFAGGGEQYEPFKKQGGS